MKEQVLVKEIRNLIEKNLERVKIEKTTITYMHCHVGELEFEITIDGFLKIGTEKYFGVSDLYHYIKDLKEAEWRVARLASFKEELEYQLSGDEIIPTEDDED